MDGTAGDPKGHEPGTHALREMGGGMEVGSPGTGRSQTRALTRMGSQEQGGSPWLLPVSGLGLAFTAEDLGFRV